MSRTFPVLAIATVLVGMHMKLPNKPGETLYFPTVQECERGVHRWIEIPAAGRSRGDYKEPAPFLKLLPKAQRH
jgi:periplasmic copper chaperone A